MRCSVLRWAVAIVYVWFGVLKIIGLSPATSLVEDLYYATLPVLPFATFLVLFGIFETLLGLLILWPKVTRPVVLLFAVHVVTTTMPLLLLPAATWSGVFVPTLEGQYIIKNVLIVAALVMIWRESRSLANG